MILSFCGCSAEEVFTPERGTVENGIYRNDVFGVSFSVNEDEWYFYSDAEISEAMGLAAEELTEEGKQIIEEADIIYDMYCASLLTGGSVNINYENLGIIYSEAINAEEYLELAISQFEYQLSGVNISLDKCETGVATVDGNLRPCLNIVANFGGTIIYECIVPKKVGDWMAVVTIASLSESEISQILSNLSFE